MARTDEVTLDNYEEKRRALLAANENALAIVMREKEIRLEACLSRMKREYIESCGGNVPYDIPVLSDAGLRESRLYRFCSRLPKGADLHVHDMALLPAQELIGLLSRRSDFAIHTDPRSYDLIAVSEDEPIPTGYMRFDLAMREGVFTVDELVKNWTVLGAADSGKKIWDYFEELFNRHGALSGNPSFALAYYRETFRYYCQKHIMHVEIHLMLTDSIDESAEYLKVIRQAYYDVKKDYPFFTVRVIGAGVKADNENIEMTKKCFLNTCYVQEIVKDESDEEHPVDFVIGFDLVNEEDSGLPLHAFAPMLLKAKRQFPDVRLYIHGGESLDANNENLIDAYLLGVSRVGHGLNLYRYPDLHKRYVASEICLEVCPVSNQVLGYARDIRNHPATEYLRTGAAIALCSDDPAYMENETLTDDFFSAVVGWDIGVAEIKQLAIQSLWYSGLLQKEKTAALRAYSRMWDTFVDEVLSDGV